MSLASLPHAIPFKLGGLLRPSETKAYGFTGLLPTKLPFTLGSGASADEVAYGSVGWELVCRSYKDFQTELLRTRDMNTLTFSRELSAIGAASFTLNLDHALFKQTLNDGSTIDTLFDYDNLWEIRFDNQIVFQILGSAVTDSQINDTEIRTATVSGSGIAKVLSWAQIFPQGFPDKIITKLETLRDPFTGEGFNNVLWNNTVVNEAVAITNNEGYTEEQARYDAATQEKENLTSDYQNKEDAYKDAESNFNDIMKDKTATTAQKTAAKKELANTKANMVRALVALTQHNAKMIQILKRRDYYGPPKALDDDVTGYLRLTLQGDGGHHVVSDVYDIKSSGVSAGIQTGPSDFSANGGTATIFKVVHNAGNYPDYADDPRNYARMYMQKAGGQYRLAAEISSGNVIVNNDWQYDKVTQKYWRIREDSGYIIFETSADKITWTERLRGEYDWPTTYVVLMFGIEHLQGASGMSPPLSAYMYDLNVSVLPNTETSMQVFRQYLETAQARNVIPFVRLGFTDTEDSSGRAWVGKLGTDLNEGMSLADALNNLTQLQQADWVMDADFVLNAYQRMKGDEAIPPVYFSKDDVVFHESGSQVTKERSRNRDGIANAIVGKSNTGEYAYIEDADSIEKYNKREAFISAGNADDVTDLAALLDSTIEELKEEKVSWKIVVAADQPGRRIFKDYNLGDWIGIENLDNNGNISVGQWRVVGIAISLAADSTLTVELTLQSRRELLIERLKQQVANMSASSSAGNTTIGSAISAATLIQQATLAGLKDVAIENPVEGYVLTYSNGYWIPSDPGDKTVPATPTFVSAFSNVYYPKDGISVRAQAELTWDTPYNIDGSFITDGHHFEVRYKPDTTGDYSATWEEAEEFLWEDLHTWAQPTIPPILNSGWHNVYVGWDENTVVIQELTPGVDYLFQIRAVDSSTPQHFSEWSPDYKVSIAVDGIAPPKPAPPVVASSYLAIQVTHYLGKADGGTFNLPPDMAYLEVHAGPGAFYPDDTTRIGKIIADNGLIRSGTPVIQTFNIDSTENIYVRVIAVDRTGNRSAPSNAVTATINLIDDAHISDLTASKITAGTISSSIILGGVIKTAETGARAEMNFEGFRIFDEDDDPTVSLLGNPATNGNFLLIKDLEDPTVTLAGIDGLGRGSFQSVSVATDLVVAGENLVTDVINPLPKGIIALGTLDETPIVGAGPSVERGAMEISFEAEESRTYRITFITEWEATVDSTRLLLRIRDYGTIEPFIGIGDGGWLQQTLSGGTIATGNATAQVTYVGEFTPGLHRILVTFCSISGNATINAPAGSGTEAKTLLWVEDVGIPQTDIAVVNDAGVPVYQQPAATPTAPTPKPKVTYTREYAATWSGTYRSNGDFSSSHGNTMVQGDSGADNWLNDARSLCGFNYQQIMSDTYGSTIQACYVTLYASHWYWNDGGTARIGTHNYTSRPATWADSRVAQQRITSSDWPKPGRRKVNIGTTIGNEFKSGAAKGIALGPTNGTKTQYGKFNGNGQSYEPVLTIVYVK
jgi:hypothetical protein